VSVQSDGSIAWIVSFVVVESKLGDGNRMVARHLHVGDEVVGVQAKPVKAYYEKWGIGHSLEISDLPADNGLIRRKVVFKVLGSDRDTLGDDPLLISLV
jgi:hypothetical protein